MKLKQSIIIHEDYKGGSQVGFIKGIKAGDVIEVTYNILNHRSYGRPDSLEFRQVNRDMSPFTCTIGKAKNYLNTLNYSEL